MTPPVVSFCTEATAVPVQTLGFAVLQRVPPWTPGSVCANAVAANIIAAAIAMRGKFLRVIREFPPGNFDFRADFLTQPHRGQASLSLPDKKTRQNKSSNSDRTFNPRESWRSYIYRPEPGSRKTIRKLSRTYFSSLKNMKESANFRPAFEHRVFSVVGSLRILRFNGKTIMCITEIERLY